MLAFVNGELPIPCLPCCAMPRLMSVSLQEARETQDDGGGEDPAHDDEDHTPPFRGTMRYPGITHVEADYGQQEVEGVEERLERWRDVRLVGGGEVTAV